MSEAEKEVRRIVNIEFGSDTGTDADYQYEHDQLNETSIEEEILDFNISNK